MEGARARQDDGQSIVHRIPVTGIWATVNLYQFLRIGKISPVFYAVRMDLLSD
jgi:hypothetical protein